MTKLHVIKTHSIEPPPSEAERLLWTWSDFVAGKLLTLPDMESAVLSGTLRCWAAEMIMVAELDLSGPRPDGCATPEHATEVLGRYRWSVGPGPKRGRSNPYREIEIRPGHPIVFMGIHGVVSDHAGNIDPELVARVARLCEAQGTRIVVTSFLRRWGVEGCVDLLGKGGMPPGLVVGVTPFVDQASRGEEIATWLSTNMARPYVILEDSLEAGLGHPDRFVRVARGGVDGDDVEVAATLLRRQFARVSS